MRRNALVLSAIPLLVASFAGEARAQGAWEVTTKWAERVRPGDVTTPTHARAYQDWVVGQADRWVAESYPLDCADFSIALLIEYASANGIEVTWRVFSPSRGAIVTVSSTEGRFRSKEEFVRWSRANLGAIHLADNTYPIDYASWRSGDMVLMRWNQSPEPPNWDDGRDVWHTYLVGEPGRSLYYGNLSGGDPLPVVRTDSEHNLTTVRTHPDRYGASPRRWLPFRGAVRDAQEVTAPPAPRGTISASVANARREPSTTAGIAGTLRRGTALVLTGRAGSWLHARRAAGDPAEFWVHESLVRPEGDARDVTAATGADPAAPGRSTPGVRGILEEVHRDARTP